MAPSRRSARQALRGVGLGRATTGLLMLAALRRGGVPLLDGLPGPARVAAHLLAGRDVVQGLVLAAVPERDVATVARAGDVVDGLHATSMLPLVLGSRRYRGAAATSALAALTWIALRQVAERS